MVRVPPKGTIRTYTTFFIIYQNENLNWTNLIEKNFNNSNYDDSYGSGDFSSMYIVINQYFG
jgi:hypothetical protein